MTVTASTRRRLERKVGQLNIQIDPDLHRRLKYVALDNDTSVTGYLTRLIEDAVGQAETRRGAYTAH